MFAADMENEDREVLGVSPHPNPRHRQEVAHWLTVSCEALCRATCVVKLRIGRR